MATLSGAGSGIWHQWGALESAKCGVQQEESSEVPLSALENLTENIQFGRRTVHFTTCTTLPLAGFRSHLQEEANVTSIQCWQSFQKAQLNHP